MTMNTYAETALYRKPLHPVVMERTMINWPEMLRHAEDWADGFWTEAGSTWLMLIAATAFVLLVRAI
jgi:hypothetical protein